MITHPSQLLGYGITNYWAEQSVSEWKRMAEAIRVAGGNCTHIELLGWGRGGQDLHVDWCENQALAFVETVNDYGVLTIINILNRNMGKGKYGDKRLKPEAYGAEIWIKIADDCAKYLNPADVILQAVSEWDDALAGIYCAYLKQVCKGFRLSWNRDSQPSSCPAGYFCFESHPCSMSYKIPKGRGYGLTDCGTLLKAIQKDGNVYGMGVPAKVRACLSTWRKQGSGAVYYGFGHKKVDYPSIAALKGI